MQVWCIASGVVKPSALGRLSKENAACAMCAVVLLVLLLLHHEYAFFGLTFLNGVLQAILGYWLLLSLWTRRHTFSQHLARNNFVLMVCGCALYTMTWLTARQDADRGVGTAPSQWLMVAGFW